jgi:endonuclease YncB( thermonuclease family)
VRTYRILAAPALLLALLLAAGRARAAAGGPRWISDDYPRALAEAKARRVPIFVDAWAPW